LFIKLDQAFVWPVLRIERDGIVVPGSDASLERTTDFAGKWLAGLGVLNFIFGMLQRTPDDRNGGIIVGVFFVMMGYFTRKGSRAALVLGTGLYALGAVLTLLSNPGAIIVQIVILIPLVRALQAHFSGPKRPEVDRRPSPVPAAKTPTTKNPASASPRFAETIAPARFAETVAPKVFAETIAPVGASTPIPVSSPTPVPSLPTPAPSPTTSGETRIGPYLITGILGTGGMATVYLARQASIGRDIALKVITGPDANDPEFGERFRREAETLAHLSHPHILKVFDFGEDAGRPYLAMEHMQGGTLRERIGGTPIPVPQVLKWAEQIGQALGSAHVQGVVHRDIKPENVLLDRNNNAFLSDFGLAHLNDARANLTRAGVQMGSPSYMPPEQWEGADVDARADLYSFAAMLFELLAGKPPFRAATLPALMTQHVKAPIPSISALRSGLPPSLDRYFARALAKAPAERFPDAASMLAAFQQALRGSFSAGPNRAARPLARETAVEEPASPPLRTRLLPAAALIVIATIAIAMWRAGGHPVSPKEAGGPATNPAATRQAVVASAVPAARMGAGSIVPLPFAVREAAYSRGLNRIVALVDGSEDLMIIDPTDGATTFAELGSGRWRGLSTSPEGFNAVVVDDPYLAIINLSSGFAERRVFVSRPGSTVFSGDWAYLLPVFASPARREPIRSVSLPKGTIEQGDTRVFTGSVARMHPSGRRFYLTEGLSGGLSRVDAPVGPVTAATAGPSNPAGWPCNNLWFSERGDYAFMGCGQTFSLTDDPKTDMSAAGRVPLQNEGDYIAGLAHSEVAGRVVFIEQESQFRPPETLITCQLPGFAVVNREPLPKIDDSTESTGRAPFVFASMDGKWVYVLLHGLNGAKHRSALLVSAMR